MHGRREGGREEGKRRERGTEGEKRDGEQGGKKLKMLDGWMDSWKERKERGREWVKKGRKEGKGGKFGEKALGKEGWN